MLDTAPDEAVSPPPKKERRPGRIILPAIVIVLLLAAGGLAKFYSWATGASGPQSPVTLTLPQDASRSDVANVLHDRGVIRSALGFEILLRVKHPGAFAAGTYHLKTNMTASDALDTLAAGPPKTVAQVRITIPEGFTIDQEASRLTGPLPFSQRSFVAAATGGSHSLPPYLPKGTKSVEGFLFPDTYFAYSNATADDVISMQLQQFGKEAEGLHLVERAKALGLTPFQVVVVASMIEEEARYPQDRVRVAEVIYNRLKRGMLLEIDATTAYAVGKPGQPLDAADYRSKSPYNTYVHKGLPPGPISSPGRDSLQAALNPAHGDLLYYLVIDKAGHEAFTSSYQEFLRLKAQAP
jgi:UPF0755 protein